MKLFEIIKNNMGVTITVAVLVVAVGGAYAFMIYDKHQDELAHQQAQAQLIQELDTQEQLKREANKSEQLAKLEKELKQNAEENKKIPIPPLPQEQAKTEQKDTKEPSKQDVPTPAKEEKEIVKPQPEFEKPKLSDNADTENPDTPPSYNNKQNTPNKPKTTEPADGTTRVNPTTGKVEEYISGFGWIQDSGENHNEIADFELSGEIIGM